MLKQIKKLIGERVIIRSYGAGVFYGTLAEVEPIEDKYAVTLNDCRRLWCWYGACSLSQLATEGTKQPSDCKFTVIVPTMCITSVIEIIPTSDEAQKSIEGVNVWKS